MTVGIIIENQGFDTVTANPEMTVGEVVTLFDERKIGAVPVLEGLKVVGIMSERDLVHSTASDGAAALGKKVSEVMTSPPISVEKDCSVLAALSLMTKRRVRHLPVVEGDQMIGFVSIGDLVKYRMDRIEADAEAMREYIAQ